MDRGNVNRALLSIHVTYSVGVVASLVPRPSTPPAFDRYWKRSKAGGVEGLGTRLGCSYCTISYCLLIAAVSR